MKNYAFCVDSDGCVMDTMTPKHRFCFGPEAIKMWNLLTWEKEAEKRWEEINLWQKTRGINRFQGICRFLYEFRDKISEADELPRLEHWLQTTGEYSERALAEEVKKTGSKLLQQVLDWSDKVNESINQIPKAKTRVFTGAKDIISRICKETDIYIISSANREAVCREWEEASVLNYVTECMTQEKGTKCECLKKVCELGYESSHVLMVGDALGDKESADVAGIPFFPILAGYDEDGVANGLTRQTGPCRSEGDGQPVAARQFQQL